MTILTLLGLAEDQAEDQGHLNQVAQLLHARTNAGGIEIGTFNTETIPTGDQVLGLIEMAIADVKARVGVPIPDEYIADFDRLVALQAAALVESSYFPNEIDSDRSAYRQYTAMFLSGADALIAALAPSALRLV